MYVECQNCGELEYSDYGTIITCTKCGELIIVNYNISSEDNTNREHLRETLPVLEKGAVVIVDNNEHPLHNQIGIICDKKHKHYRLELEQKKIWVPEHWVKYHECDGIN